MQYQARIYVTLKPVVNDPQGLAVKGSLHRMGYGGVSDVRVGKLIEVKLEASDSAQAEAQAREMCRQLLANPVIEDFRFELTEAAAAH